MGLNQQRSLVQIGDDELLARAPRLVQADHELLQWNVSAGVFWEGATARDKGGRRARARASETGASRRRKLKSIDSPFEENPSRSLHHGGVRAREGSREGALELRATPFAGNVAFHTFPRCSSLCLMRLRDQESRDRRSKSPKACSWPPQGCLLLATDKEIAIDQDGGACHSSEQARRRAVPGAGDQRSQEQDREAYVQPILPPLFRPCSRPDGATLRLSFPRRGDC